MTVGNTRVALRACAEQDKPSGEGRTHPIREAEARARGPEQYIFIHRKKKLEWVLSVPEFSPQSRSGALGGPGSLPPTTLSRGAREAATV